MAGCFIIEYRLVKDVFVYFKYLK